MSEPRADGEPRSDGKPRSYYGQAVIKEPVWTPEIPLYFFAGGLAGASAGLAYLSELRGEEELGRRGWAVALVAVAASPPLLISDLGVPSRFLNMLRMFKVTSPMSVGSWILSASGAATAVAALHAWTGRLPRLARLARPAAAALGLPLSTYTAALVSDTAVPVWHEAHRTLPFVFAAGAAASAGAVAVAITPPRQAAPARRVALAGAALELGATELMERRLGELGEPYREGVAGRFGKAAKTLVAIGSAGIAAAGRRSRALAAAGGVALRRERCPPASASSRRASRRPPTRSTWSDRSGLGSSRAPAAGPRGERRCGRARRLRPKGRRPRRADGRRGRRACVAGSAKRTSRRIRSSGQ